MPAPQTVKGDPIHAISPDLSVLQDGGTRENSEHDAELPMSDAFSPSLTYIYTRVSLGKLNPIQHKITNTQDILDFVAEEVRPDANGLWAGALEGGAAKLRNPHENMIAELARTVLEITGSRSKLIAWPLPMGDPLPRCPDIGKARRQLDRWLFRQPPGKIVAVRITTLP